MSTKRSDRPAAKVATELSEEETLEIEGGVGLLLPAVQAAREAAVTTRQSTSANWPAFKQR